MSDRVELKKRGSSSDKIYTTIAKKLATLHVTLNKPPYYNELNTFFLAFLQKHAVALDYQIGIQDFKQILAAWDMKAPLLFSNELEIEDAINIVAVRLVMDKHPLARCFWPQQ